MRRLLILCGLALGTILIAGCGSGTSVPVAPDVKEPDNRNVSGEELLRRKQAADAAGGAGPSAGTTTR